MFNVLLKDRYLILLLFVSLFLRLFALNSFWVEHYYTFGVYPVISKTLRFLFGWLPFSIGDLLYVAAFVWLVIRVWKLLLTLKRRQAKAYFSWLLLRKFIKLVLVIYTVFMLFWGLNYYRQGIEKQLDLRLEPYSTEDLYVLTKTLAQRISQYGNEIDSVKRARYEDNRFLFGTGQEAYRQAVDQFPFLHYSVASIKPSTFTPIGNWFGFTGYCNPFTNEAQLKADIPVFLKPFVVCHEMAHQLGYAKENEANFVAFLACKASANPDFLYSAYFDVYRDAIVEYASRASKEQFETLKFNFPPRFSIDMHELQLYFLRNKNFIEPFVSGAYDSYLRLNNQPNGTNTYDEVIVYLVAYMKKYGKEAI